MGHAHETYGVAGGGHGEASAGAGGGAAFHFPFFSPLALATLFAAIGAWGLIAKFGFGARDSVSLLVAVPAAFVTAYVVTYAGFRLVSSSRGSSAIRAGDLTDADAEVITPIPAGGVGEVAALVGGQRFTSMAREERGGAVPRGAMVKVVRMAGNTLIVTSDSKENGNA
jgi:membrane protein implicated in regulation of membrane protease activity